MRKPLDQRIYQLARDTICEIRRQFAAGREQTPLLVDTVKELEAELGSTVPKRRKACGDCPGCGMMIKKTLH